MHNEDLTIYITNDRGISQQAEIYKCDCFHSNKNDIAKLFLIIAKNMFGTNILSSYFRARTHYYNIPSKYLGIIDEEIFRCLIQECTLCCLLDITIQFKKTGIDFKSNEPENFILLCEPYLNSLYDNMIGNIKTYWDKNIIPLVNILCDEINDFDIANNVCSTHLFSDNLINIYLIAESIIPCTNILLSFKKAIQRDITIPQKYLGTNNEVKFRKTIEECTICSLLILTINYVNDRHDFKSYNPEEFIRKYMETYMKTMVGGVIENSNEYWNKNVRPLLGQLFEINILNNNVCKENYECINLSSTIIQKRICTCKIDLDNSNIHIIAQMKYDIPKERMDLVDLLSSKLDIHDIDNVYNNIDIGLTNIKNNLKYVTPQITELYLHEIQSTEVINKIIKIIKETNIKYIYINKFSNIVLFQGKWLYINESLSESEPNRRINLSLVKFIKAEIKNKYCDVLPKNIQDKILIQYIETPNVIKYIDINNNFVGVDDKYCVVDGKTLPIPIFKIVHKNSCMICGKIKIQEPIQVFTNSGSLQRITSVDAPYICFDMCFSMGLKFGNIKLESIKYPNKLNKLSSEQEIKEYKIKSSIIRWRFFKNNVLLMLCVSNSQELSSLFNSFPKDIIRLIIYAYKIINIF
jgi:hypothetical protein